jgi:predicted ATPase
MQPAAGVGALLGRDVELALLRAFLERRPEDGAAALLLEGEAGIGKTAVWRAATEVARERGFRVLRARPSEAERTLSFAALADLLGDAHEVIEQLPAVRRRPLAVALLLEDTDGPTPDRRAIGAALLTTLRTLAEVGVQPDGGMQNAMTQNTSQNTNGNDGMALAVARSCP